MVDMYRSVMGFPNCSSSENPKFRWQRSDPRTGVDFKVWKQSVSTTSTDSDCNNNNGLFYANGNNQGGKCYTYQILKRICLMIAFKVNPQTASYYWEYRGGCYGTGEIGVYEKGVPGQEYKFDQIPIEVREDESLYVIAENISSQASSSVSPLLFFASSMCLVLAIISGFVFAFLFYKAWKSSQPGSAMRHQVHVDAE